MLKGLECLCVPGKSSMPNEDFKAQIGQREFIPGQKSSPGKSAPDNRRDSSRRTGNTDARCVFMIRTDKRPQHSAIRHCRIIRASPTS